MVKVSKYSDEKLKKSIAYLNNDIYLLFYDLSSNLFDEVVSKLKSCLKVIDVTKIKYHHNECLIIFCHLKNKEVGEIVQELKNFDIGELEISEYENEQEAINIINELSFVKKGNIKSIYVNYDENVIQFYNFN